MRTSSANFGCIQHRYRLEEGEQRELQAQLLPFRFSGVLFRLPATGLFHIYNYLSRGYAWAVKGAGWYRTGSIGIALNTGE
jgi:hypothetical protein